jgi:replicative DNA helicase
VSGRGLPPAPAAIDLAAIRHQLATWPAGLPVAPAWAHPALHWDAGALSVVAAPTSAGKTTFLAWQILDWLQLGIGAPGRILIWSAETPAPLFMARLIGMLAGQPMTAVAEQERRGLLAPEVLHAWSDAAGWADRLIVLDDTGDASALALADTARALAAEPAGLTAVIIDYLQELPMVHPDHPDADRYARSREAEVGAVARCLRQLAAELQVPVIAAAQFNRTIGQKTEFVPDLLQLRESGRIEQNAAMVLGLRNAAMSGAPDAPPPGRDWTKLGGDRLAYHAYDELATARLGAQMGVREQYGPQERVLAEVFVLKNRWRGHVGIVVPVALEPASGRWLRLAARYVPPAAGSSGQRGPGSANARARAFALVGGQGAQTTEEDTGA